MFGMNSNSAKGAIKLVSSALQNQLNLADSSLGRLAAARDNFALGYVFGFSNGLCQNLEIEDSAEAFQVLCAVCTDLADSEGVNIVRQYMDLHINAEFTKGMSAGVFEAFKYHISKSPPLDLVTYLQR